MEAVHEALITLFLALTAPEGGTPQDVPNLPLNWYITSCFQNFHHDLRYIGYDNNDFYMIKDCRKEGSACELIHEWEHDWGKPPLLVPHNITALLFISSEVLSEWGYSKINIFEFQ